MGTLENIVFYIQLYYSLHMEKFFFPSFLHDFTQTIAICGTVSRFPFNFGDVSIVSSDRYTYITRLAEAANFGM